MAQGSRLRVGVGVFGLLVVSTLCAGVDCGVAHAMSHPVHKVYTIVTQMRFDADGAILLFGVLLLGTLRSALD
jgi:hypothetical protein